jgi:hypothetical protein
MAMEMTAVWKERKSRSPFPLFPHCLGKLAKTASFPHSHSFGDDLGFPSSPSSFNFNCNEKCSLHARYLLLPTCQFAQRGLRAVTPRRLAYFRRFGSIHSAIRLVGAISSGRRRRDSRWREGSRHSAQSLSVSSIAPLRREHKRRHARPPDPSGLCR